MTISPDIAKETIQIIGLNPDTVLNNRQVAFILDADIVYTGQRHRNIIQDQITVTTINWQLWQSPLQKTLDALQHNYHTGKKVVVIASGDPMCYGIGATINRQFADIKTNIHPAPSSFSLAAAKLKWSHNSHTCISLHQNDDIEILSHLADQKKILCLTKNQDSPINIAKILCQNGWGKSLITVLQELGSDKEQLHSSSAQEILDKKIEFQRLNIVSIDTVRDISVNNDDGIFFQDQELKHDGQLTKFAFRAVTIATLNPAKNRVLWDIGAGSGSISLAWLRLGGTIYAIEKNQNRCENIKQNTYKYPSNICTIIQSNADDFLQFHNDNILKPDAIFFGGALQSIEAAMEKLKAGGVLVANAVTIPSQQLLSNIRIKHGGQLRQIAIAEEDSIAGIPALKPARNLLQYWWHKP